jgi:hypothetical protein
MRIFPTRFPTELLDTGWKSRDQTVCDWREIPEFPDKTELHDTGQHGPQRFRKPKVALVARPLVER